MKPSSGLLLFSAIFLALLNPVAGQVQTLETQTGYAGSVQVWTGNSGAASRKAQVFTDVEAVALLTYNFFAGTGGSPLGTTKAANFTAQFGEWNPATNNLANVLVDFGSFTVPPNTSEGAEAWSSTLSETGESFANWSHSFDFTARVGLDPVLGLITDASKSYAMLLTITNWTTTTNIGLGVNESDFYRDLDGEALLFPNGYYGNPLSGNDYVFSQISIVPAPVPEASTVAAMIGAAFIAGLVGLRIRQRRQLAAPSAAPAAA